MYFKYLRSGYIMILKSVFLSDIKRLLNDKYINLPFFYNGNLKHPYTFRE